MLFYKHICRHASNSQQIAYTHELFRKQLFGHITDFQLFNIVFFNLSALIFYNKIY